MASCGRVVLGLPRLLIGPTRSPRRKRRVANQVANPPQDAILPYIALARWLLESLSSRQKETRPKKLLNGGNWASCARRDKLKACPTKTGTAWS